jgi:hypothetical protein
LLTIVIGRRKRGKSTLAYAISLQKPTRVTFDPRRQFHTTDDIIQAPEVVYDMLEERSEIIVQPYENVQSVFDRTTFEISDWIDDNPQEQISLLADEVRFLDTPNRHYEHFDRIIRFSDPEKVDAIMTCHRPSDISVDIRAIADYWCIFHTTQEHDLKIIGERCGNGVVEMVRTLRNRGEFILWDDGEGIAKLKNQPSSWFVPIDRKVEVAA